MHLERWHQLSGGGKGKGGEGVKPEHAVGSGEMIVRTRGGKGWGEGRQRGGVT